MVGVFLLSFEVHGGWTRYGVDYDDDDDDDAKMKCEMSLFE